MREGDGRGRAPRCNWALGERGGVQWQRAPPGYSSDPPRGKGKVCSTLKENTCLGGHTVLTVPPGLTQTSVADVMGQNNFVGPICLRAFHVSARI